jgi:hypothetical protein
MVVVALPGNTYSGNFLVCWTRAVNLLFERNYEVVILNRYSSYVTFSRMLTLGLDVLRGVTQTPFDGKLPYDVWVTIDSDVLFTPEQLIELIEATEQHPVVSGIYRMADGEHYAAVKDWNETYFASHGTFQFLKQADMDAWVQETQQRFMPVAYNGMGFFAVRRGVFEKLTYPYFVTDLQEIRCPDGRMLRDTASEDVALCRNLSKAGIPIMILPGLRVGHEKKVIL